LEKEKIKLTLENFDEIAFDLLKKENGNSTEIEINWDYSLEKDEIKEIFDKKNAEGLEFSEAVLEYITENDQSIFTEFDDKYHDLAYMVVEKYSDFTEDDNEFFELKDKLYEYAKDNFNKNLDYPKLLKNTKINELAIVVKSPETDFPDSNREQTAPFVSGGEKYIDTFLADNQFNSIAFLIQSQGYEVEDFFDKEKVENSKFLKSLHTELEENLGDMKDGNVVFTKLNSSNLDEFSNIVDNIYNLKIPKEMLQVGIYDLASEKGSNLEIELEKDIVLSKENYKVFTEYSSGDKFEINHFFEDYESKKDETKFEISLDKNFEMHEVDLDKIKETIDKNYNFDINETKKDYEREF
jgi:hypothetical protein